MSAFRAHKAVTPVVLGALALLIGILAFFYLTDLCKVTAFSTELWLDGTDIENQYVDGGCKTSFDPDEMEFVIRGTVDFGSVIIRCVNDEDGAILAEYRLSSTFVDGEKTERTKTTSAAFHWEYEWTSGTKCLIKIESSSFLYRYKRIKEGV